MPTWEWMKTNYSTGQVYDIYRDYNRETLHYPKTKVISNIMIYLAVIIMIYVIYLPCSITRLHPFPSKHHVAPFLHQPVFMIEINIIRFEQNVRFYSITYEYNIQIAILHLFLQLKLEEVHCSQEHSQCKVRKPLVDYQQQ